MPSSKIKSFAIESELRLDLFEKKIISLRFYRFVRILILRFLTSSTMLIFVFHSKGDLFYAASGPVSGDMKNASYAIFPNNEFSNNKLPICNISTFVFSDNKVKRIN